MKKLIILLSILILFGCLPEELIKLASEYSASIGYFNQAQKDLRKIQSDCNYKRECFEDTALRHIQNNLCPNYQNYNFVSERECNRAGDDVLNFILDNRELSIPVRNTAQDDHNQRMYDLEKERNRQEQERWQAEQRRQDERDRAEQRRQDERAKRQKQKTPSRLTYSQRNKKAKDGRRRLHIEWWNNWNLEERENYFCGDYCKKRVCIPWTFCIQTVDRGSSPFCRYERCNGSDCIKPCEDFYDEKIEQCLKLLRNSDNVEDFLDNFPVFLIPPSGSCSAYEMRKELKPTKPR